MDEQATPTMRVFGLRTGARMLEMMLCFLTASCAFLAVSFFFVACLQPGTRRGGMYALASLVAALMAFGCGKFGLTASRKAHEFIVFDPVNTADLPASNSLIRASTEPAQAHDAVLLRAAAQTQERHEEQLLRVAARQE